MSGPRCIHKVNGQTYNEASLKERLQQLQTAEMGIHARLLVQVILPQTSDAKLKMIGFGVCPVEF